MAGWGVGVARLSWGLDTQGLSIRWRMVQPGRNNGAAPALSIKPACRTGQGTPPEYTAGEACLRSEGK